MPDTTLTLTFSPEEYIELKRISELFDTPVEELAHNAIGQLLYQKKMVASPDTEASNTPQVTQLEGIWKDVPLDIQNKDIRRIRRHLSKAIEKRLRKA